MKAGCRRINPSGGGSEGRMDRPLNASQWEIGEDGAVTQYTHTSQREAENK